MAALVELVKDLGPLGLALTVLVLLLVVALVVLLGLVLFADSSVPCERLVALVQAAVGHSPAP